MFNCILTITQRQWISAAALICGSAYQQQRLNLDALISSKAYLESEDDGPY